MQQLTFAACLASSSTTFTCDVSRARSVSACACARSALACSRASSAAASIVAHLAPRRSSSSFSRAAPSSRSASISFLALVLSCQARMSMRRRGYLLLLTGGASLALAPD